MNDPQLVAALRDRDPDVIAALFDAYAEALFQYCWLQVRSQEAAQVAVRDALVVAAAHADRLRDPGQLRQWLYALARAECGRRRPVPPASADEPPARPNQPDADSRVVAWNAVTSMSPLASEVLDLTSRHGMPPADAALVLGVTEPEFTDLLSAAKDELGESLAAQLVVRRGGFDCAGLTTALRGWAGTMTPPVRSRVLEHAAGCAVCGRHLPRNVAPPRVYELLPAPVPFPGMREEVLAWLADPRHSGYRDFAGRRAAVFTAAGFPAPVSNGAEALEPAPAALPSPVTSPGPVAVRTRGTRRRVPAVGGRILAGIAAAGVAGATAATMLLAGFPGTSGHGPSSTGAAAASPSATWNAGGAGTPTRTGAAGATPVVKRGPGSNSRPPLSAQAPGGPAPGRYGQALFLSARQQRGGGSATPSPLRVRTPPPPPPPVNPGGPVRGIGTLAVSPGQLNLGTGSQGSLILRANGGPVNWTASTASGSVWLSTSSGSLAAGQSVMVTVTVTRHAGGSAEITFSPGQVRVQVCWAPQPSPSPSAPPPGGGSPQPSSAPSWPPHHHRPRSTPCPSPSSVPPQSPAPSASAAPHASPSPSAPSPSTAQAPSATGSP
jgi:DNA-directed RNA polymerase specialized sigma24 family protein